jgi:hypothetical protein
LLFIKVGFYRVKEEIQDLRKANKELEKELDELKEY